MPSSLPVTNTRTVRMQPTSQTELRKLFGLEDDERVTRISLGTDGNPDGAVFIHVERGQS